jgi:DNA-binding transcriptional MocR family regulator
LHLGQQRCPKSKSCRRVFPCPPSQPEGVDAAALLPRAVEGCSVAFVPGGAFHPNGEDANTLRLSYSLPTPEAITAGVRRLASLL